MLVATVLMLMVPQLLRQPWRIRMEDFVGVQASSPCWLQIAAQNSHVVVVLPLR